MNRYTLEMVGTFGVVLGNSAVLIVASIYAGKRKSRLVMIHQAAFLDLMTTE
ncbi:hypothetical protein [Vibrio kanaloae]|uniref:hypothetical protein n=1 Tax=Vibrio kanaloae TaxID=170673 RepID=UPI0016490DA3|nr:hypothetical protein [Vibrio kanaloae]MCG9556676.1 hypothetical protein [Vibrio kanaloae]